MDVFDELSRHNSHQALQAIGDAIYTGVRGTNVRDLRLIYIGGSRPPTWSSEHLTRSICSSRDPNSTRYWSTQAERWGLGRARQRQDPDSLLPGANSSPKPTSRMTRKFSSSPSSIQPWTTSPTGERVCAGARIDPHVGYRVRTLHAWPTTSCGSARARGLADDFQILDERETTQILQDAAEAWSALTGRADGLLNPELDDRKREWVQREHWPKLAGELAASMVRQAKTFGRSHQRAARRAGQTAGAAALLEMSCAVYGDYQRRWPIAAPWTTTTDPAGAGRRSSWMECIQAPA